MENPQNRKLLQTCKMWDPNIHMNRLTIKLFILYVLVENSCIPSHGKSGYLFYENYQTYF